MRLAVSRRFEQFGSVRIHETQRVIELDAGSGRSTESTLTVSRDELLAIESQMAIVVLCMNEELKTIESVFSGIPRDCLIVLVSNSSRAPCDRYQTEVCLLQNFCRHADRSSIAIHQKDAGVARAFVAAGAPELVGSDGLVHNGKGEGMLVGMALAALARREYIGFIDADNYVPGSVLEYCKAYAAGLHSAKAADTMVRLSWSSKPKWRNGRLMFDRKGRSSRIVNQWFNDCLQEYSGYGTDCINTGNAGEHAMTISLAKKLKMASGFAVEPYEIIYLLEQMGNVSQQESEQKPQKHPSEVHIHQIETRNPHLHDNKGDEHVGGMCAQGLGMIYHSPATPLSMKDALQKWMEGERVLSPGQVPPKQRVYPALEDMDLECLRGIVNQEAETLKEISTQPNMKVDVLVSYFSWPRLMGTMTDNIVGCLHVFVFYLVLRSQPGVYY